MRGSRGAGLYRAGSGTVFFGNCNLKLHIPTAKSRIPRLTSPLPCVPGEGDQTDGTHLSDGEKNMAAIYSAEALEPRVFLSATPDAIALGLDLPDGVVPTYTGDPQAVEYRINTATGGLLGVPTKQDDPDFVILS